MRRSFYDPSSAPGQGWQWEWENDAGTWTAYDMEVAIAIENAHSRQQPCLDLTPIGFCYLIDFQNMTQVCLNPLHECFLLLCTSNSGTVFCVCISLTDGNDFLMMGESRC